MRTKVVFTAVALLAAWMSGSTFGQNVTAPGAYDPAVPGAYIPPSPAVNVPAAGERQFEIPVGTKLKVRLNQSLDTARNRAGQPFSAVLDSPVAIGVMVAIPEGTAFRGHLISAKPSGRFKGRGIMSIRLDSFEMNGQQYKIMTSANSRSTPHHKSMLVQAAGGSKRGALINGALLAGGIATGGATAVIGAGAHAAARTGGAALTGKKQVHLASQTLVTFSLRRPIVVIGPSVS